MAGVGAHAGSMMSKELIKYLGINNAYINAAIAGGLDGYISGFVGGASAQYVRTGDLDRCWQAGLNGAATGAVTNVVSTFAQKKGLIRNEWNGKTKTRDEYIDDMLRSNDNKVEISIKDDYNRMDLHLKAEKTHFDKMTGTEVDAPHIHISPKNTKAPPTVKNPYNSGKNHQLTIPASDGHLKWFNRKKKN